MREIKVLDCTLRDGGRCFGNSWGDETIKNMSYQLSQAGIDIIEIGFLWYLADGICRENTTLFRNFYEIESFLCPKQNYVAYIEYEVFERGVFEIIPKEQSSLNGIRLGVLKEAIQRSIDTMKDIVDKGYQLYLQGINILSYSDDELLEFINVANEINPYAFAIVDTFGDMEQKDLIEKFEFIHNNLNRNISVALHSHNNNNLSLTLAKTFIDISADRDIVIDSTLLGIGMGGGNLNTELITKYLNKKTSKLYDIAILTDLIEKYIFKFRQKFIWGYTSLSVDSAKTWRSQIQVSYITSRYKDLPTEQQRYLLAMCPIGKGTSLEQIDSYYKMLSSSFPKESDYNEIKKQFCSRKILLVATGPSVLKNKKRIEEFVRKQNAIVIYINAFETGVLDTEKNMVWYFFTKKEAYQPFMKNYSVSNVIKLAGLEAHIANDQKEFVVHVKECAKDFHSVFGDATMWTLNLLCGMKNECEIYIVGFDGGFSNELQIQWFKKHILSLSQSNEIKFLTNSVFENTEK